MAELELGKSVSYNLKAFVKCFQPMSAQSDEGAKLRKKGWSAADPNGNGLVSLAEAEGFVLLTLLASHPKKDGKEPGRDLFDAYRPCFIKAFNDAKDYKKDDGKVLAGTKSSKADDFVSRGEFRYLCAYLCIYASMYDAFSLIDGGGAGRAGDDRKIDLGEWMAGYKSVTGHGFWYLADLKTDKDAKDLFFKIDSNGGGAIMLDEWCVTVPWGGAGVTLWSLGRPG